MTRIGEFKRVSFDRFKKDVRQAYNPMLSDNDLQTMYDLLELPRRATKNSAGYDFKMPFVLKLEPNEEYLIPTGIKCNMFDDWVLTLYPRSGLGFKYGFELRNTVGVIDSDYAESDNEGHIMAKVIHHFNKPIILNPGDGFMQGIFLNYGITFDDFTTAKRNGGFGSTDTYKGGKRSL